jgi:hypothetical protein
MTDGILDIHNGAFLVRNKDGKVSLCFRGLLYDSDDPVASNMYAEAPPARNASATFFVEHYLSREYGTDVSAWPSIAREFVAR